MAGRGVRPRRRSSTPRSSAGMPTELSWSVMNSSAATRRGAPIGSATARLAQRRVLAAYLRARDRRTRPRPRLPFDADRRRSDLHADHAGRRAGGSARPGRRRRTRLRAHTHAVRPHAHERSSDRQSRERRDAVRGQGAGRIGPCSATTSSSGAPSTTCEAAVAEIDATRCARRAVRRVPPRAAGPGRDD